jgi:hypothetical protein
MMVNAADGRYQVVGDESEQLLISYSRVRSESELSKHVNYCTLKSSSSPQASEFVMRRLSYPLTLYIYLIHTSSEVS